uniref:Uncharacterized protein n=1 Tax=Oryza brachyantha TaxID=4533 RepID=J3NCF5_ORYBR
MIFPICPAMAACPAYLGAKQHPPFLSINHPTQPNTSPHLSFDENPNVRRPESFPR